MEPVIRTRCTQGWLIVTDEYISIVLGGPLPYQQTVYRSALTGIDSRVVVPSIMGFGGGVNLVFYGSGVERLHANMVKPSVARVIIDMLQEGNQ